MVLAPQKFGGTWSLLKVEAVANYLTAFNQALSKLSFSRVYIDAFAGSGEFTFTRQNGGGPSLFNDAETETEIHAGSAKRALLTQPEFHRLIFIENKPKNILARRHLADADSKKRAVVVQGDANTEVKKSVETQIGNLREASYFSTHSEIQSSGQRFKQLQELV